MTEPTLTRRAALTAALAVAAGSRATAELPKPTADPAASDLDAYLAMRFAGQDRPVWWVNRATILIMVLGRAAVPMFDVIGLGRNVLTKAPDGTLRSSFDECGWYCAPGTYAPLAKVASPINGRTITVKHYRSPNETVLRNGVFISDRPVPSDWEVRTSRSPLHRDGDEVWMTDDIFVRRPRQASTAALAANPAAAWAVNTSLNSFIARAGELARHRPGDWLPTVTAYQTLASWRDWFDADEVPGVTSFRMHGTKVAHASDIPQPLRGMVESEYATLLQA